MLKRFLMGISIAGMLVIILFISQYYNNEQDKKTELVISAAASLQESLELLQLRYEEGHPGIDLVFNYGSSGTLQQQIEQGAPVDVFMSAGENQMNQLIASGWMDRSKIILTNELVLIVPSDHNTEWSSYEPLVSDKVDRIAIGQPETVPAGLYTKQSLTALGIWETVKNKLIYAKDVRQVLNYVETGNADAGFVYLTDTHHSTKSRIVMSVNSEYHQPILYPAGILADSKLPQEALDFYDYLSSNEAQSVFMDFGFKSP